MMRKGIGFFLIILSFIFAICIFNNNNIILKYFGGKYNKVIINTNVPASINGTKLNYEHNNYFIEIVDKVGNLTLHTEKPASYIYIFNGQKNLYGLLNLKTNTVNLPYISVHNTRSFFTVCMIFLLSLFMAPQFYLSSYLLFFAGLFLLNPKNVNPNVTLGLILLFALFFRLCGVFEYPFWIDEVYTFLNTRMDWSAVLKDWCNPPLFYIISKLWLMVVPEAYCRLLSVIAGVAGVWSFYYLLKEKISEKTALVGGVLMATSYWGIYYSQEYRCYAILMFLVPLCTLSMFNIIEKREKIDYFLYSLYSALIINLHLFGLLYVFGNYIYLLFKNFKNKLHILKAVIISGVVVVSTFLPYFFMTFLPHSILDANSWHDNYLSAVMKVLSVFYVVLFVVGVLFLYMFIFKKNDLKEYIKQSVSTKEFFLYCIYIICIVFITSLLISAFRLVVYYRYYSIIYPFVLAIISVIISQNWKTKYSGVLLTFLIILNIIFQFKLNFPLSLRYGNYYDLIKMEREVGISKGKIEVVLDYLTHYNKYYDLKDVNVSTWRPFLWEYLNDKNTSDTIYLISFQKDKQKFIDDNNFTVIIMPNDSKLVRIEK